MIKLLGIIDINFSMILKPLAPLRFHILLHGCVINLSMTQYNVLGSGISSSKRLEVLLHFSSTITHRLVKVQILNLKQSLITYGITIKYKNIYQLCLVLVLLNFCTN